MVHRYFFHSKFFRIYFFVGQDNNEKSLWLSNHINVKSLILFQYGALYQGEDFDFRSIFTYNTCNDSLMSDFDSSLFIKDKITFFLSFDFWDFDKVFNLSGWRFQCLFFYWYQADTIIKYFFTHWNANVDVESNFQNW